MKLQNIFRMQAVVVGLGAALLLAGVAHAQEIDNQSFDEGANSVPFAQPARTAAAATEMKSATQDSQAASIAAMAAPPLVTQEASVSARTPVMVASLVFCLALTVLYVRSETRRRKANIDSRYAKRIGERATIS